MPWAFFCRKGSDADHHAVATVIREASQALQLAELEHSSCIVGGRVPGGHDCVVGAGFRPDAVHGDDGVD
jgi:hypothetical protein